MFTERSLPEGGLNLASGPPAGPPLLLLHGVTRCWQDFGPLLPALSCRRQVFGLDFRGHGRSGRRPGRYRVVDYLEDATAVLRDPLPAPAVVYGHSLGALVALAAAATSPDRARGIVLEDPPAAGLLEDIENTPFYPLFQGLQSLAGDRRPVREVARDLAEVRLPAPGGGTVRLGDVRDGSNLRFGARSLKDVDPEVLRPLLEGRWLEGYDFEALCGRIACPVLLLRADEAAGGMLSRRDAEGLADRLADCTLIDLPGVGHLAHWLAAEAVVRLTLGFLESLD
jgi:pimeloyl-ACP methyl ester carboxylesterase